MPVTTRSQTRRAQVIACTERFRETVENPCVLMAIIENLSEKDLVALKQVSKDAYFNDVIDKKLKNILHEKLKEQKIIKKLKLYLLHIDSLYYIDDKIYVMNKMYQYLCGQKWFVKQNYNLAVHIEKSLFRTIADHQPFQKNGVKYLQKIFNLKPPQDYYNSKVQCSQYGMFSTRGNFVHFVK